MVKAVLRWTLTVLGLLLAAVVLAGLAAAVLYAPLLVDRAGASSDAYLKALTDTRTMLVQGVLGLAVFLGALVGYLTLRQNRRAHQTTLIANRTALDDTLRANRESLERTLAIQQRGQVTDRFSKAVEQLGSDRLELRIGGIYALEQIAKDDRDLHGPIIEILTAFVRAHAYRSVKLDDDEYLAWEMVWNDASGRPPADIEAIMTVLRRRNAGLDSCPIDLSHTDLLGVDLAGVNLERAILRGVWFAGAQLPRADFSRATLLFVELGGVDLDGARFIGADLRHVKLNHATSLLGTDFTGAYIEELDPNGAFLGGAYWEGVEIHGPNGEKLREAIARDLEDAARAVEERAVPREAREEATSSE